MPVDLQYAVPPITQYKPARPGMRPRLDGEAWSFGSLLHIGFWLLSGGFVLPDTEPAWQPSISLAEMQQYGNG
jgi:hypothetical protein